MTEPTSPNRADQALFTLPSFPPGLLLTVAGVLTLLVAFGALLAAPALPLLLGVAAIVALLVTWGVLAPQQRTELMRGRFLRYGGTAALVTGVLLVVLVLVYIVVRNQNWNSDFSNQQTFTLTDSNRQVVAALGADPTTPDYRIIGFVSAQQAGARDQAAVLLDDYVSAGNGRISYEFIDPDQFPQQAERFGAQPFQFVVTTVDADGTASVDNALPLDGFAQQFVTSALLTLSSRGDYRLVNLVAGDTRRIDDSGELGLTILASDLRDRYRWTVSSASLVQIENNTGDLLSDTADGQVLLIAGGTEALTDEALTILTDYIERGGSVVMLAMINGQNMPSLATDPQLNDTLEASFGLRIDDNIVFDPPQSADQAFALLAASVDREHPVFASFQDGQTIVMEAVRSIRISPEPPDDVTVSAIASSSGQSYTRSGIDFSQQLSTADFAQTASDPTGPFVMAAAAENRLTGGRLVVFGSESLGYNQYVALQPAGILNQTALRDAIFWAAGYSREGLPTTVQLEAAPVRPLFATSEQISQLNLVTIVVLPGLILLLGVLMNLHRLRRR